MGFLTSPIEKWRGPLWAAFGNVASVLAGLATIKVTTLLVDSEDYGKASLVLGILALLNNMICGPLLTAHMRVYFDYSEKGLASWYTRQFRYVLLASSFFSLLVYVGIAAGYVKFGNQIFMELGLAAAILIFAQSYFGNATTLLEAARRYTTLAIANISPKFLQLAMLLFLLKATSLSPAYSIVLSQALALLVVVLVIEGFSVDPGQNVESRSDGQHPSSILHALASFGMSLPLGYLAHWVLSTSDRYLLGHFLSLRDVGVYAMNYGLWSMPYLLLNGWLEIVTRPRIYQNAAKQNWSEVAEMVFFRLKVTVVVGVGGGLLIFVIAEPLAGVLLGVGYWVDRTLVLFIAGAHLCMAIGYSVVPLYLARKTARHILNATILAAATNVGANLMIIPRYGIHGAAATTLLAYAIWALYLWGPVCTRYRSIQHFESVQ